MKIKAGIIGYGRNGSTMHADGIGLTEGFEMAAVCDIDPEAREKAKARFGCKVFEDYHEMLREDLDFVAVVTKSCQHSQMACDVLRSGKNVLVTKPWALNRGEAEAMITAANESGKLLLPWLPSRWAGDLTRLRELIAAGAIGRVFQVRRGEYTFGMRNDWQMDRASGGGYLLNWGPHIVDQPLQLLGKPAKTVFAQMRQTINPGDAEDVFHAMMVTEDGVIVDAEFNIAANVLPNWVVQGTEGTIVVRGQDIQIHKRVVTAGADKTSYRSPYTIEVTTDDKGAVTPANRYGDTLEVYAHILRALRGEVKYAIPPESALMLTRTLDAIRASNTEMRAIAID